MEYETVVLEKEGNIGTVTLNRPEKLNALNDRMAEELVDVLGTLDRDEAIRAVVVTGAGRAFSAGADIQEFFLTKIEERNKGAAHDVTNDFIEAVPLALARVKKPVIASINGAAVGFGCTITLGCDIRIASDNAKFSLAFARVGLSPEMGSSYFLPRLVGIGKACELVFTGKTIDAKEAKEMGLVNQVVPADELREATYEMASNIAKLAPLALRISKRALYRGLDNDLITQVQHEAFAIDYLRGQEDHKEGAKAFLEKREPIFKGT